MADTAHLSGVDLSFGTMSKPRAETVPTPGGRFRIALMGDFSGRSARGIVETGADLANRRPIKFDIDTLEKVIAGFAATLILPIGKKGAGIEVELSSIDDLHPDELFEKVEMFEALVSLKRRLASGGTSRGAITELREWGKEHGKKVSPPARTSRGNAVPADRKLSEFSKLIGGKAKRKAEASSAEDLIARLVGPYITAIPDADNAAMQEAVEESLSAAMRLVLHHPEFQSVEAQWRMLDLIARSIETDSKLDIVLYDISAEELAADLSASEELSETGLFELLVESTPDGRGPFSAICGLYTFEETPPHAELLGRIAQVAAHVNAPFFAAISPAFLETPKDDRHPLVAQAWDALRALPEAAHVALVSPRFLLRRPYGAKSDPIYEFEFEEFTVQEGLSGMLWANPVVLVAILLAKSFRKNGPSMGLGSVMSLGEIPYHYVNDSYGDQIALPCTERNLTASKTSTVIARGYIPVLAVKGRDDVRLGSFQSLAGETILGPWTGVPAPAPKPVRELVAASGGDDDDMEESTSDDSDSDSDSGDDDADLAALLAGFDDDSGSDDDDSDDSSSEDDEEMDPELAALLAGL